MSRGKILLTGAGGFLGSYILEELCRNGYEVIAIKHKKPLACKGDKVREITADLYEDDFAGETAKQTGEVDAVIHAAADISVPGDYETFKRNLKATWNIIELANELHVSNFVYLSSVPVIGNPASIPVTEEHAVHPKTPYHMSKYFGELMVSRGSYCGKNAKILRIPSPIGVGMKETVFLYRLLSQCKSNMPLVIYGRGGRVQNYVDVRDVAHAVSLSLIWEGNGTYIISGAQSISNRDLACLCKKLTNSESEICAKDVLDPEENIRWELSGELARKELSYDPKYSLEDSIRWIYSHM